MKRHNRLYKLSYRGKGWLITIFHLCVDDKLNNVSCMLLNIDIKPKKVEKQHKWQKKYMLNVFTIVFDAM